MDSLENPVRAARFFSMEASLEQSANNEHLDATADTGPIDSADHEARQRDYDLFYGTSPLSSTCPTPTAAENPTPDLMAANAALATASIKRQRASTPEPDAPAEPTGVDEEASGTSKTRRDKKKSKKQRQARRRKQHLEDAESKRMPERAAAAKHIHPAEAEPTLYSAANIPSASTGYIALPDAKGRVYTLAELKDRGFRTIQWDGRTARPITDSDGRIVAVLAGQPADPAWESVHEDAFRLLYNSAPSLGFTKKATTHRRGNFPAVNVGVSFGGGQMRPGNLYHPPKRASVLQDLTDSPSFTRIAGFASSTFRTWLPGLYDYYDNSFDSLLEREKRLSRNFDSSVWAAVAYNFGPRAVCAKHRDFANLPFGICSVTVLGDYDPTLGGHIVMWDFGLVVEFPPGSTVLIPSAAVAHSNTPIAPHEQRASFTQYTAGGLFRWVDHGFQTDAKFMKTLSKKEKANLFKGNEGRSKLGLSLFPTLADLRKKYI